MWLSAQEATLTQLTALQSLYELDMLPKSKCWYSALIDQDGLNRNFGARSDGPAHQRFAVVEIERHGSAG